MCSNYGGGVHLPIPRSKNEKQFYQAYFSNESLWLDISYDASESVFKSVVGHVFVRMIETVNSTESVSNFEWINFNPTSHTNSGKTDVIMSNNGTWTTANKDDNQFDSVCVFNLQSDESCKKCYEEAFCHFTDKKRLESKCVCPVGRDGKYCDHDTCECKNGGYCQYDKGINSTICVCQKPFYGSQCELAEGEVFESWLFVLAFH